MLLISGGCRHTHHSPGISECTNRANLTKGDRLGSSMDRVLSSNSRAWDCLRSLPQRGARNPVAAKASLLYSFADKMHAIKFL